MRISVPDFVSSSVFPLIVAQELGIFREEGEEVEILHTYGLGAAEALRDGSADFTVGPAHVPLIMFPNWIGVKLLATVSRGTPWMLVMRSTLGAGRGDLNAVKGRRIAAGRGPDLVLKHMLREAAIDIEKDGVEIGAAAGTTEARVSFGVASAKSLAEGSVDGIWANVLGCEIAVQLGTGSLVVDPRRGDGPPGAGNYSFCALSTVESKIETEPERIAAVIRALVRAESLIRHQPARAAEVARKLFPPLEAEAMGRILARDGEFYRPSISMEAIERMNLFASAIGLLSSPLQYEQVVATQFRSLWSE
jgi:NitT/TauT family transport system substrate-binding protein